MEEQKVLELMEKHPFKFAKTMPTIPHSYTLVEQWENKDDWYAVVDYIKNNGVVERFFKKEFVYLYLGEYKYWVMDEHTHETTLINRAKV